VKAHVLLHVRGHPSGPVVVTPVPFVDLAYEAGSVALAVEGLRRVLHERLRSLEAVDRLPYAVAPEATLLRVPVEVEVGGRGGEAVEVTLGVVAVRREVRGKAVLLGYVPVLPQFEALSRDGNVQELVRRTAPRLAKQLRSWSAEAVLNADEPSDSRLEVTELDVEEGLGEEGPADAPAEAGVLEERGVDLTSRTDVRFDGREELVARVLDTLAAPGRSSVLLVGPSGVGKSALVHETARRIATGAAPAALAGRSVWRLSANELIAGASYTGMWQQAAQRLISQARRTGAVIVMGDPVGIVDAGRWSGSDNNVSRYLRPYIESGEVTVVCEATSDQLAAARKLEPGFIDAFHRIDLAEPSTEESREIVAAAVKRLAEEASLSVASDAVGTAVELTGRFEPYHSFPGKAIRLFEDAVRGQKDLRELNREALIAAFSRRSGMPLVLLSDSVPLRIEDVRSHFETRVLGQPDATKALVDLVSVVKAGLNDPQKPLGSLFFVGPTGVGKTESAKALAEFLFGSRDRLVRFDMGEYVSYDAVQKLIGTPWGSEEGELTRGVREQPFCVVLLDEIEKAHWSVFDALLAAIGEGRVTDAAGRVADFRNAIVIMTSNLGARQLRKSPLGFSGGSANGAYERYVEEAERFFRPEFFNRIDRVVVFHPLSQQTVREIARRELDRLLTREGILRRQLLVELDEEVIGYVAASGFHPRYGARPLQRAIERVVLEPLARLLVERRPEPGGFIRIHLEDGSVAVDFERVKEPASAVSRQQRRAVAEDSDFARAERTARDFSKLLADDEASVLAGDVHEIAWGLIELTHARSFWDDAESARSTLQRIYQLEHLLDRLDGLRVRAAGLIELARRVRETQNRARLGEIRSACEEMEDELLVLRLELAAAASGSNGGDALLRVIPIGKKAAAWAERLVAMYSAWAGRTARDATRGSDDLLALAVSGPATLALLRGEAGLHRHVRSEGQEVLARVVVKPLGATSEDDADDPGVVVRVYEEGKRRGVRDPRTGIRESHLDHVLEEGRIDAFLIASLRDRAVEREGAGTVTSEDFVD
jgi:ATP-dependent Clp protease ATP-binding subunit ClpA